MVEGNCFDNVVFVTRVKGEGFWSIKGWKLATCSPCPVRLEQSVFLPYRRLFFLARCAREAIDTRFSRCNQGRRGLSAATRWKWATRGFSVCVAFLYPLCHSLILSYFTVSATIGHTEKFNVIVKRSFIRVSSLFWKLCSIISAWNILLQK